MRRPSHCAATTRFRSSCSTFASQGTSRRSWPGAGQRRSFRTRSKYMPAYDKNDLGRRMHGALDSLKHDLAGLRTGRASTALLDPIQVEVYGANMPINQVATVSVPEPRT